MNNTKSDQTIIAAADEYRNRIDVNCNHGSGFFKEYVNKDGSVERRPCGYKSRGYWHIKYFGYSILAHRLRWYIENGDIPYDMVINHINNNTDDNSIQNLELSSISRNCRNKIKQYNNKYGVPCVVFRNKKWTASATCNNIRFTLTTTENFDTARIVRDRFFLKCLIDGDPDIRSEENRLAFIESCHLSMGKSEQLLAFIEKYNHLIYSTIEELCGESFAFKRKNVKGEYQMSVLWKPNKTQNTNHQIYEKVLETFEYRRGSGLWRKNKNNEYVKVNNKLDIGGYELCRVGGISLRVHSIIWMLFNGAIPEGKIIDHIDSNRSNNVIENLTITDNLQNSRKRIKKENTSSKYIGVNLQKGRNRWTVAIKLLTGVVFIGNYKNEEEAALVRDRAYALRFFEETKIITKEDREIFINRCNNKLNLTSEQIIELTKHLVCINNKDLSAL